MSRKRLMLPAIACFAAACATTPPAESPDGKCDAAAVQQHVGKEFRPNLGERAKRQAGARSVRLIRPGQAVTMDFRDDRLNIELDAGERITALRCG